MFLLYDFMHLLAGPEGEKYKGLGCMAGGGGGGRGEGGGSEPPDWFGTMLSFGQIRMIPMLL